MRIPEDLLGDANYVELTRFCQASVEPVDVGMWRRRAKGAVDEAWRELVNAQLAILKAVANPLQNNPAALYPLLHAEAQSLFRLISSSSAAAWILPLLHQTCSDLWSVAKATETPASMEEAARAINKAFTLCITDRNPDEGQSRKWGFCRMAGLLFRIYFYLGQLNLCNNVLRAIAASQQPALDALPAAHLVTYRYYLGRYHFINERYAEAEEHLALAFLECHAQFRRAKRQILHLLIPCRLLVSGRVPCTSLLERYGLTAFYAAALKDLANGNVRQYEGLLAAFERQLLRMGTFGVWERLALVAQRSLVRLVWRLDGGQSRLPLDRIAVGLGLPAGQQQDTLDQVGCILANLIDTGLVKGYISYERATAVLSQKDPFASLTTCRLVKN
jgi:tetratricopeptide (TPR) repeat protein